MDSFNKFLNMGTGLESALRQVVEETAYDVEAFANRNAPKDTGFLAGSIYTVTKNRSSYAYNRSIAPKGRILAHKRKKVDTSEYLPEIEPPDDNLTAYIGVGAPYGMYVELGTSKAPAQPFLVPAVEEARPYFEDNARIIEGKLREIAEAK